MEGLIFGMLGIPIKFPENCKVNYQNSLFLWLFSTNPLKFLLL